MNNTRTLAAIAAISIIAATLVVGGTFAALTTPQSALAYQKKKAEGDKNSKNGNTITEQKCKQAATESGFDNTEEQECGNTICTHPGSNATCVSEEEGAVVTPTSTSTSTSTSSPPIPVNPVLCTNTQGSTTSDNGITVNQCCLVINQPNTTTGATGGTTTGGAQTATGTCTVTVTSTVGATTGLTAGAQVPISTMSLKSSNEKCINGASGSLNTGTGRTFSVCVNV
jgi:hypothetical protein